LHDRIEALDFAVRLSTLTPLYYYGGLEKEKRNFELCKPFRFDLSWPIIGLTGAPTYLRNIETEKSKKEFKIPLSD
jgi:hypothetical protein